MTAPVSDHTRVRGSILVEPIIPLLNILNLRINVWMLYVDTCVENRNFDAAGMKILWNIFFVDFTIFFFPVIVF